MHGADPHGCVGRPAAVGGQYAPAAMGRSRARSGTSRHDGVGDRLRYRFDNLLARGVWAVLAWLALVTVAVALVSSVLLRIAGLSFASDEQSSWLEDLWQSLLRTIDPGTMAGDVGWGRRVLALLVTIFGLLVAGTLIGLMANAVEERVDRMRRGRSAVIEKGHTVVLGATDRLGVVIAQLVLANRSRGGGTIVVLADRDPAQMREEVEARVHDAAGSRIVYRSGEPWRPADLDLLRLGEARRVLVLGDDGGGDTRAVKTVLAIGAELGGFGALPIVVELEDPDVARHLVRACGPSVHPLVAEQAVARVAAFALREPGMHRVVEELFDLERSDLQVLERAEPVGEPFSQAMRRFANARPVGIVDTDGGVHLNPPRDRTCRAGDRLVVIAADPDRLEPAARPWPSPAEPPAAVPVAAPPEDHLLVVGWNRLGAELLSYWATGTAPGSTVAILVDPDVTDPSAVVVPGVDPGRATVLTRSDGLPDLTAVTPRPTVVVLLGAEGDDPEATDAGTLLDLATLLRELRPSGGWEPRFVVELLDVEHLDLARVGTNDHVVSQAIGSQFLAQLADQPARRDVYLSLYAPDGASLRLVEASQLGLRGPVSTVDVLAAADRHGLLAIGWCRSPEHGDELVLNPDEAQEIDLGPGDRVVVVG